MRLFSFCCRLFTRKANCLLNAPTSARYTYCGAGNRFRYSFWRIGGTAGGGALLSLSLFGKSNESGKGKGSVDEDHLLVIREADLYFESNLVDNAYNILRRYRTTENPEILWRFARVLYKQGRASQNPEEQKRLYYEAFDFVKKALENQPATGSFGANKWYAILLDRVSELEGIKTRISKSIEVKAHFERALEINPIDYTTWHLLGVWHYEIANLSTSTRWIASVIFAKPPESTFDEALRCFERSENLSPGTYSANNYYLGLAYEKMKRYDEALIHFKNAYYMPIADTDDKDYHEKALNVLRRNYKYTDEKLLNEGP